MTWKTIENPEYKEHTEIYYQEDLGIVLGEVNQYNGSINAAAAVEFERPKGITDWESVWQPIAKPHELNDIGQYVSIEAAKRAVEKIIAHCYGS